MPYRVDLRDAGADAFDRLVELGALDAELSTDGGLAVVMPDRVPPEQVARALGLGAIAVSPALARDGGATWVLSPRPIRMGRVRIAPAGGEAEPGVLSLVDAAAFGTGLHPTTSLCLEAIDDIAGYARPAAVLDVGTGSGVLALAALMLGVPRALGLDIDGEAIRVAGENARLNALDDRLQLVHGGPNAVAGSWPLVVANVLAAPLIEMAPALVRRVAHHGQLVLSGVPASVEPDVYRAYHHLGMQRVRTIARDGWVALVLRASW